MNTNPIPEKLKERFEQIYYGIVGTYPDSYDLETMHQAYQLAEGESKKLRYDYEAAVLRIDELEKRLAEGQKWISVEYRLPSEGEIVLACGIGKRANYCKFNNGLFERYIDHIDGEKFFVLAFPDIHSWQPLPTLPTPPVK